MTRDGVSTKDTWKQKRKNYADSTGTDGAIEGQSPAKNCTNGVSHATRAAEQAKQKSAETTLVVTTTSTVPPVA